ncbi:hypothetical protein ABKN59_007678 [Abortiporus biennis]
MFNVQHRVTVTVKTKLCHVTDARDSSSIPRRHYNHAEAGLRSLWDLTNLIVSSVFRDVWTLSLIRRKSVAQESRDISMRIRSVQDVFSLSVTRRILKLSPDSGLVALFLVFIMSWWLAFTRLRGQSTEIAGDIDKYKQRTQESSGETTIERGRDIHNNTFGEKESSDFWKRTNEEIHLNDIRRIGLKHANPKEERRSMMMMG